ncbi:MAG: hypothetical protein CL908_14765 [Deltaproteobacteria bacterium]|nr:hypothetical protein [Deltaproteobacteria bacterium]
MRRIDGFDYRDPIDPLAETARQQGKDVRKPGIDARSTERDTGPFSSFIEAGQGPFSQSMNRTDQAGSCHG